MACDLAVDAGPDTSVCAPGGTVQLQGSITGNDLYFEWTPAGGLSNSHILNPTATVSTTTTYTLTAWAIDPSAPNLVFNGDFEMGNVGFTTAYSYVADLPGVQNEMVPEGTYTVVSNPNLVHTGFNACSDHTPGSGTQMMVINGSSSLQDVWCQTVMVEPNAYYDVSAWVASVNPASPAQLQFSINNVTIGSIVYAPSQTCQWVPFNAVWNSGSATTAEICILNLNTAAGGNDFAIDDIAMYALCKVEDEVTIDLVFENAPVPDIDGPAFACEGDVASYTADFPNDPPVLGMQWSVSSGGTILGGQGSQTLTVAWNTPGIHEVCLALETRCDMDEGCFEIEVGTVPDLPLLSGPTLLCPGETASYYTPEQSPDDTYLWTVPANAVILDGQGSNAIEVGWVSAGEVDICVAVTNACGTTDNCTTLELVPSYYILFDTTICEGTTFELNGTTYGNGVFTGIEYFVTEAGCDSIVEVEVTEAGALVYSLEIGICAGDSIFAGGAYQWNAGMYVDSFVTAGGCDSIILTNLMVGLPDTLFQIQTTCDSASIGMTIVTFPGAVCDSTVITETLFVAADTTLLQAFSCFPADTGTLVTFLSNQSGCDSLVFLHTLLLPSDTTWLTATSCDPADTGTVIQVLMNTMGCDSSVILSTRYVLADTTYVSATSCSLQDTGLIVTLLTNSDGCDSLVFRHTAYGGSDTTFLSAFTCDPAAAGVTYITLANVFGCDSIVQRITVLLPSDTTYLAATTCDPADAGTTSILLANRHGCDSLVITNTVLLPIDECDVAFSVAMIQPPCHDDTAFVTLDMTVGLPPFVLTVQHPDTLYTLSFPAKGNYTIPLYSDGDFQLELASANGLVTSTTVTVNRPGPIQLDVHAVDNFNGYQVPCFGDLAGRIEGLLLSTGTAPLQFAWSSGQSTLSIDHLGSGTYTLTVTDSHGCQAVDSASISEPLPFSYSVDTLDVRCFGESNGSITVQIISGGVPPVYTSLNGSPTSPALAYTGLGPGPYSLAIRDANGCGGEETLFVDEPADWRIDLPVDTTLPYGSPYSLQAIITGQPQGMPGILWSDDQCPGCLARILALTDPLYLQVTATDDLGCIRSDEIRLQVRVDRNIYIPNVFSPNGDGLNDRFLISADATIDQIASLLIFDRWGNAVFHAENFAPNDPAHAWDGSFRGQPLQPAVFAYRVIVSYVDGREGVFFGDVTLLR